MKFSPVPETVNLKKSGLQRKLKRTRKQDDFLNLKTWLRGFVGGRGTGKTRIGAIQLCLLARNAEPWMVVSPDSNVIEETTWTTFEEVAREWGLWIRGVRSPIHRAFIRTFDGGTTNVVFKSAEKPEKLRGSNKAGLWFDEASVMSKEAYLYALPVLRWRGKMGPCLMTFTPKGKRHWTFECFYDQATSEQTEQFRTYGTDGAALVGELSNLEEIGGTVYQRRERTGLITAHTLENRFLPREFYETLRAQYSTTLSEQELSGKFIDLEGLLFRREWFKFADAPPRQASRVRYWDLAATEDGGCFTVGTLMSRTDQGLTYVEDVVSGQWSALVRDQQILETARRDAAVYNNEVTIYIEQEGGSGGKEQAAQMVRMLAGYPVYRDLPSQGQRLRIKDGERVPGQAKITRARPLSAQVEAGNVYLIRGRWTTEWLDKVIAFPESKFMDEVDSASAAFNRLAASHVNDPGKIGVVAPANSPADRFGVALRRGQTR